MGILDRLNRLIRSNLNDAVGDRGASFDSAIKEMESSLREARREQAKMRRNERELVEAIRDARDRAEQWEERAMMALQENDEKLAKEALQVKNEAAREAEKLREELREHRSHMEDIDASLEALEMKLQSQKKRLRGGGGTGRSTEDGSGDRRKDWDRKLERRRSGRSGKGAETDDGTSTSESLGSDETFEEFDRMAGKIDAMEAEIEAMRELSGDELGDSKRARLERIFRKMEGQKEPPKRGRDESTDRDDESASGRDTLAGKKNRLERLSELKDKFDDED